MPTRKRQPSSKRRFIAKATPLLVLAAQDTTIPALGQRKRAKKRPAPLSPLPSKAD